MSGKIMTRDESRIPLVCAKGGFIGGLNALIIQYSERQIKFRTKIGMSDVREY